MNLPESLRELVLSFPETSYGAHTVSVTLKDQRMISGVHVAWGREVVTVDGQVGIPFSEDDIVGVDDASGVV